MKIKRFENLLFFENMFKIFYHVMELFFVVLICGLNSFIYHYFYRELFRELSLCFTISMTTTIPVINGCLKLGLAWSVISSETL